MNPWPRETLTAFLPFLGWSGEMIQNLLSGQLSPTILKWNRVRDRKKDRVNFLRIVGAKTGPKARDFCSLGGGGGEYSGLLMTGMIDGFLGV